MSTAVMTSPVTPATAHIGRRYQPPTPPVHPTTADTIRSLREEVAWLQHELAHCGDAKARLVSYQAGVAYRERDNHLAHTLTIELAIDDQRLQGMV